MLGIRAGALEGMGGYFMTVIKMELTPDKNYVWGKLVVQGVCLSA